jgi:hypothetical protein
MVDRSTATAQAEDGVHYTYQKLSRSERLDAAGKALTSEEKLYTVTLIAGLPFNRLIRIQGRDLTPEELAREDAKEEKFRQRLVSADTRTLARRKEGLVTPELLGRYDFVVEERLMLSNRSTLVLSFKPKPGELPARKTVDKLLNRMTGKIWVDEADADTARLEAHLVGPVWLGWFGWLGSLTQCDLVLERRRMSDGVWINRWQSFLIQYRKLTTVLRLRTTEESSGFKQAAR